MYVFEVELLWSGSCINRGSRHLISGIITVERVVIYVSVNELSHR